MLRVCEESEVVEFEAVWEGEGRFRMRIVGWYAAGGGGTTDVPVLEGEMISSGMGALLFLHSNVVNDSVINSGELHGQDSRVLPYFGAIFFLVFIVIPVIWDDLLDGLPL